MGAPTSARPHPKYEAASGSVVDDEPAIRQSLSGVLEDEGYNVESAESGEASSLRCPAETELVLLDICYLASMAWRYSRIQEILFGESPVVVVISVTAPSKGVKATKLGAFDFLEKPLRSTRLPWSPRTPSTIGGWSWKQRQAR